MYLYTNVLYTMAVCITHYILHTPCPILCMDNNNSAILITIYSNDDNNITIYVLICYDTSVSNKDMD